MEGLKHQAPVLAASCVITVPCTHNICESTRGCPPPSLRVPGVHALWAALVPIAGTDRRTWTLLQSAVSVAVSRFRPCPPPVSWGGGNGRPEFFVGGELDFLAAVRPATPGARQ